MATTIEQIRKVNIYEEDEYGKRTLVQKDVPLGSNVVLEEKVPENKELNLLIGEKDVAANEIKLYPTSVTVSSDGKINAKDFLIDNNNIKGKFVSNIYWGEDSSITPPVRRLYYKINDNSFQVKNSGGTNALNLLQVPYLELYSTNTIKTSKSTDYLCLNVNKVDSDKLVENTKVVLGHTAIKDSCLDLVDNSRGYLGARLGVDTREGHLYGYLDFFTPIKEKDGTLKTHEIGNIYADPDKGFCILPKNILHKDINISETDEILPVIAGCVGVSDHKFEHIWAKNLHGNIQPVVYAAAPSQGSFSLADLGFEDQFIYIGQDFGNSKRIIDMPFDSVNGYCITLKSSNTKNSGSIKQIFIRGGTKGTITEKRIYIRTGYKGTDPTWSYGDWTPALGHTDWDKKDNIVCLSNVITPARQAGYFIIKDVQKSIITIRRQYLDIYQYRNIYNFLKNLSITEIEKAIDNARKKFNDNSACGVITIPYYYNNKLSKLNLLFTYNNNNEVCLGGVDLPNETTSNTRTVNLQFKQYD